MYPLYPRPRQAVGKNFVYQMVRKLAAKEKMPVPHDQLNTPTYNRDLADATKLLVEADASGIFNVGGEYIIYVCMRVCVCVDIDIDIDIYLHIYIHIYVCTCSLLYILI